MRDAHTQRDKMKSNMTFSIDQDLINRFRKVCEQNGFKQSAVVGKLMREFVEIEERRDPTFVRIRKAVKHKYWIV